MQLRASPLGLARLGPRSRPDGHVATDVPGYRRFMPALMPTRTGSTVFLDQVVEVDAAQRFVAETRAAHPDLHPTLFHVVLWALGRMFDRHPHLNRFVSGGRLYDRDGIWISFTVKTELTDEGTLVEVKHRCDPTQPFADFVRDIEGSVALARAGAEGLADKELSLFLHLPPLLRRGVVRLAGLADGLNVLPRNFIVGDPFFASVFVTNLGSVGIDAGFHHLYDYGTIPLFCTLGLVHDGIVARDGEAVVTRVASLKFSYDERIEDGLYAARAVQDLCATLHDPASA
jgi:pyruvate/2-oxoglutarate dehydrogenase complex dihydrolipoamide acyltransferase (E2) component